MSCERDKYQGATRLSGLLRDYLEKRGMSQLEVQRELERMGYGRYWSGINSLFTGKASRHPITPYFGTRPRRKDEPALLDLVVQILRVPRSQVNGALRDDKGHWSDVSFERSIKAARKMPRKVASKTSGTTDPRARPTPDERLERMAKRAGQKKRKAGGAGPPRRMGPPTGADIGAFVGSPADLRGQDSASRYGRTNRKSSVHRGEGSVPAIA